MDVNKWADIERSSEELSKSMRHGKSFVDMALLEISPEISEPEEHFVPCVSLCASWLSLNLRSSEAKVIRNRRQGC